MTLMDEVSVTGIETRIHEVCLCSTNGQ